MVALSLSRAMPTPTPARPVAAPGRGAAALSGHSPESGFLQAYGVSELGDGSPLTFGLAAPRDVRVAAAADLLARHGGGGDTGDSDSSDAARPPAPALASPADSPERRPPTRATLAADGGADPVPLEGGEAAASPPRVAATPASPAPSSSRPWPLAAPRGTWLYDITLPCDVGAAKEAAAAGSLAERVLARRACSDADVGAWSPAPADPDASAQTRTVTYVAPVAGGLLGGSRVACVERHTLRSGGGGGASTSTPAPSWTLTIDATTPDLPVYGGAFRCEIVVAGAPAKSGRGATRVTAFGRVVFLKRLAGLSRRMLEAQATAGLKSAYAAHARELARGGGAGECGAGALEAALPGLSALAIVAAAIALTLAVAALALASAVRGLRAEVRSARADLASIAAAVAAAGARQCRQ